MNERLSINNEYQQINQDWSILSDLAKTPEQNNKYYGCFTSENTKHYIKDRFSDNLSMLKLEVQDDAFVNLYEDIVEEYPILRTVALQDEDIKHNAYFTYSSMQSDGTYAPEVACNMSHCETYAFNADEDLNNSLAIDGRLGEAYIIKRIAFSVGANWEQCAKNVRLNADFTLLHELGHAHDFIENYIRPEYEKIDGNSRGAEALFRARTIKIANREEFQKCGPNPEGGWLSRNGERWRKHEKRLKAMGIDNYDEYRYAVHQYYRDMPDEAYADNFAYDYIIRHYDKYFTTDKNDDSGRIFVDETRGIELDPDFVHILGLKQGLGVEIDRLDKDRKSVKHIKGFLALNMYVGKSVYLYENGDPQNPGEKWRIARGISEMTLKPIRDPENNNVKHYVFFKDEDGVEYHVSRTQEEPETVKCSPDEMAKELGLKAGDKVQLIEHLDSDARTIGFKNLKHPLSQITEGEVLYINGENTDNDVVISYENGNTPTTLNYPPKRKWKTWYVGNYEILPLPRKP